MSKSAGALIVDSCGTLGFATSLIRFSIPSQYLRLAELETQPVAQLYAFTAINTVIGLFFPCGDLP
jgi:hypothetical protein